MNIRLAYDFDLQLFERLFPGIKLFNWEKDRNNEIDLLVFPGGEDVSLEYYLDRDTIERYGKLCHCNPERDEQEIKILKAALSGELAVKRIFGVCRGMQLFAVMFGGSLFFDLETYGFPHEPVHEIRHVAKTKLDFFRDVNSMHHQGVKQMGDNLFRLNLDRRAYPKKIAVDDSGQVIEIGSWLNDKVLGVQFHPEYFREDREDKSKFREFVNSWIVGSNIS